MGHSKSADHPAQEVSIDMACVDRAVSQAPLFNFKGGPDDDPDVGDTYRLYPHTTSQLTLPSLAAGVDEKLSALAQVATEQANATHPSIANQNERVLLDAPPSAVGVKTPGACFQVSHEVMSPTSDVGVTTPGVCSQIPQDVGRLVDPAPMGTVQSAQDTSTLRDNSGEGTNDSRTFVMRTSCYQQLSASEFLLFEKQTQGKKPPTKDDQPSEIWWPTANPNMIVVNLMWILQNLADIVPKPNDFGYVN